MTLTVRLKNAIARGVAIKQIPHMPKTGLWNVTEEDLLRVSELGEKSLLDLKKYLVTREISIKPSDRTNEVRYVKQCIKYLERKGYEIKKSND